MSFARLNDTVRAPHGLFARPTPPYPWKIVQFTPRSSISLSKWLSPQKNPAKAFGRFFTNDSRASMNSLRCLHSKSVMFGFFQCPISLNTQ